MERTILQNWQTNGKPTTTARACAICVRDTARCWDTDTHETHLTSLLLMLQECAAHFAGIMYDAGTDRDTIAAALIEAANAHPGKTPAQWLRTILPLAADAIHNRGDAAGTRAADMHIIVIAIAAELLRITIDDAQPDDSHLVKPTIERIMQAAAAAAAA